MHLNCDIDIDKNIVDNGLENFKDTNLNAFHLIFFENEIILSSDDYL